MILLLALSTPVSADEPGDLPTLAQSSGWAAVSDQLKAIIAANPKPKNLAKALTADGFYGLQMPAEGRQGAELSLSAISKLQSCTLADGHVTCVVQATAPGSHAADFTVQCKVPLGSSFPLTATGTESGGQLVWTVADVQSCWDIDANAVQLVPVALNDLEGVGLGDDNTAPELVELSQDQVEQSIRDHYSAFQYCTRKFNADHSAASGRMEVRYHIAADGTVDKASVESATFSDDRIQQCIVDVFQRLRFPKPMGGFEGGTFPLTFVGG